jgi:ATP-dependent Clp protease ATP-binding subunit ClpA
MIADPWIIRAGIILFVISLDHAAPGLAETLIVVGAFAALLHLLIKGRYLPRFAMDILDRLTDKSVLQRAYEARGAQLAVINAEELAGRIKARVVGQNAIVDRVVAQLRRRLAAQRPDKPIAVFCFAGPPAVGKTHLAKTLAEELYSDRNHLHFFDMSQFGQPHAAASLFGQARGYVGSQSYGALTAALRDVPNAVVLLDEFEKAHPEVHKRFLTAWNDGFITELSDGSRIATNEAIFVLTTNAAARRIGTLAIEHVGSPEDLDRLVKSALQDAQFAPEVLSRIDEVFAFGELRGLDIARVVALEIERLARQFGLEIEAGGIEPAVLLGAIEAMSERMDGGVRDIARAIERQITDGLIEARTAGTKMIRLVVEGERVRVLPVATVVSTATRTADTAA